MQKPIPFGVLVILLILSSSLAFSQPKSKKFGKVDDDLVRMKTYEADPDAEAVVTYNYGRAFLPISGAKWQIEYVYHKRIKVLTEAGLSYADFEIPYYAKDGHESVFKIKGITHSIDENGKITKVPLEKKDIYTEDVNGSVKKVRFSMPQVTVGSIVEVSYCLNSLTTYNLKRWYFQEMIPVMYSEYVTKIPEWFTYRPSFRGYLGITDKKETNYSESVNRTYTTQAQNGSTRMGMSNAQVSGSETVFIMENVPAFVEEQYSTTATDYLSSLEFQRQTENIPGRTFKTVISTWEELAKELRELESFGRVIKPLGTYKKQLEGVELEGKTNIEKAAMVFDQVRNSITWNDSYGMFVRNSVGDVFKKGEGNSGEINLIMTGMMKAAGLNAYPVLISTRRHGIMRKDYPIISQFNHVITLVDIGEGWVTLDAVSKILDFGVLPVNDLNRAGLLITDEAVEWIDIKPVSHYKHVASVIASIDDDQLKLGVRVQDKGYSGANSRVLYNKKDKKCEEFLQAFLEDGFTEMEIDTAWVKEYSSKTGFVAGGDVYTSDFINQAGDFIYVEPMMNEAMEENPFKLEKRMYPVDIPAPIDETYTLMLTIPEGYEVAELPAATKVVTPDKSASFMYQAGNMGQVVQLQARLKIDKTLFLPDEYEGLKSFYDHVVKKQAEQIVLKRKT
ncbi:MAG: DUF3857 domain-containing protein [Bacteroidota bacterium]